MFLQKTKNQALETGAPHEAELKSVTENLYKQNQELAVKNKTLSLLRELYQISIQTLEPAALADKFAETIQKAFEFELVAFFSYDKEKDELVPIKFVHSKRWQEARESLSATPFAEFKIESASQHRFFSTLIREKKMLHTESIIDIWKESVSVQLLKDLQEKAHVKSSLAYPLISDGKIVGVLLFSLNRNYINLVQYEQESIASFINPIAIALDKAYLYEQVQAANKELATMNEQQVNLIHFITHQVKGFLSKSRNAFSMLLEGDYGEISPEVKALAVEGLASGTKGVATVEDILNAANIKKGSIQYSMVPFDLKPLVTEIFEDHKTIAAAKGLHYALYISEGDYGIVGDAAQLKNVIKNLIDNSVKYTPEGSTAVALKRENDKVVFSVKDTGVGISLEDKKRLFMEGGRGKESTKVNVDSTGYGLYIVKGIVEAHHGRVWAESQGVGRGSAFYVELPVGN